MDNVLLNKTVPVSVDDKSRPETKPRNNKINKYLMRNFVKTLLGSRSAINEEQNKLFRALF
jgi:hypothetical protein